MSNKVASWAQHYHSFLWQIWISGFYKYLLHICLERVLIIDLNIYKLVQFSTQFNFEVLKLF